MPKYGQYCPLAQALEAIGDRWTLLIIRDMITGITHFNDLERGLPGISRGLLASRLRQLERAGIIQKHVKQSGRSSTEYHLTQAGIELQAVLLSIVAWSAAWIFGEPTQEELDPLLLMWSMHNRVYQDLLPQSQVIVQFNFYGAKTATYWLLMKPEDVTVCLSDPGFDIDILVNADLGTYFRVWFGRMTFSEAMRKDLIKLDGPPHLCHAFPNWFALSLSASIIRDVLSNVTNQPH